MKKKIRIAVIAVIMIIVAVLVGWNLSCYSATEKAEKCLDYTDRVNVINEEGYIVFEPTIPYDTGLIFYPGAKVDYKAYAPLMMKLADEGIFCAIADMPMDFALLDQDAAKDIIADWLVVDNWYIGGHSLGGVCASMYAAEHTDLIDGVILLAAYSNKDISSMNVLSIYGSKDKVLNIDSYEENKDNLPEDFTEYVIKGGNHAGFAYYGKQKGDGKAAITREEQQRIAAEQIIGFIDRTRS